MIRIITIMIAALLGAPVCAEPALTRVGLAPDAAAMTQAEAVTASARGSTALLYNPAGLARKVWGLKFAEYYESFDQEAIDTARRLQRQSERGEDPDLSELYGLIESGKRLAFEFGATVLQIQVPYAAARGFGYGRATLRRTDVGGEAGYDFNFLTHVGAAAGAALTYGRWSLGVARYYLVKSELTLLPTEARVAELAALAEAGELVRENVPFAEFTRFSAGNALGTNWGLLWQPWDDNPTGIGVALLNAGGTSFTRRPLVKGQRSEGYSQKVEDFATKCGLTIENPEPLAPLVNAGGTIGYGGATADLVSAALSVDYHDIGGDTVQHKLAGSAEVEAMLPPVVAKALSVQMHPPGKNSKTTYQIGLLGGHVMAGARESEYSSYGAGISFHAGANGISPLRLDVDHYVLEAFDGDAGHRRQGFAVNLALTLVL